jgi:hypothetical protein
MKQRTKVFCLFVALVASTAHIRTAAAQTSAVMQGPASSAPVAFIYVASNPNAGKHVVNAFAAAANGKLTVVPGSPFKADIGDMAVNGKYLFGSTSSSKYIAQFLIQPNGALQWTRSTNIVQHDQPGCNGVLGSLVLDHTGATIYDEVLDFDNCGSNVAQSFKIEKPSGVLKYLGNDRDLDLFGGPLSFIGNNVYAYGAECDFFVGLYVPTIRGFQRQSDGLLTSVNISAPAPPVRRAQDLFCPALTAADPTNHVAISFQAIDTNTSGPDGLPQLATYTADNAGNLSTTSTYKNMPTTNVGLVFDLKMSPSGKLLAVAGLNGLQIFHFNGSNPITHYTGLITTADIEQCHWDNSNHLYALSSGGNKLYVFTVTPTSVSQVTGSPYAVKGPFTLVVQPKTSIP